MTEPGPGEPPAPNSPKEPWKARCCTTVHPSEIFAEPMLTSRLMEFSSLPYHHRKVAADARTTNESRFSDRVANSTLSLLNLQERAAQTSERAADVNSLKKLAKTAPNVNRRGKTIAANLSPDGHAKNVLRPRRNPNPKSSNLGALIEKF